MKFEELFPIVILVLWVLKKLFSKKEKGNDETAPVSGKEEERTRDLQKEILRKIRERRNEKNPPQMPADEGEIDPVYPEMAEKPHFPTVSLEPVQIESPLLETDDTQQIAPKFADIQEVSAPKSPILSRVKGIARSRKPSSSSLSKELLSSLRDPHTSRKAILYLEVFGPPVGQRSSLTPPKGCL